MKKVEVKEIVEAEEKDEKIEPPPVKEEPPVQMKLDKESAYDDEVEV